MTIQLEFILICLMVIISIFNIILWKRYNWLKKNIHDLQEDFKKLDNELFNHNLQDESQKRENELKHTGSNNDMSDDPNHEDVDNVHDELLNCKNAKWLKNQPRI